ncbi:hypothetical protein HY968_01955 [Candidatus Kaiserbacteria bacterium]|nr:hypothetical protein [Candidatus Kaiserbacteria bacterium]
MPSDTTLPGAIGWALWFSSELAFKWLPGTAVALLGGHAGSAFAPAPQVPAITNPVTVTQVADFLRASSAPGVYDELFRAWSSLVAISIVLSLILASILIYCLVRILQIRRAEYRRFEAYAESVAAGDVPKVHLRWNRVRDQANSDNVQNWRLAVLEADIMLKELLESLGYRGETMADKMRVVDKTRFNTIDLAWEAHRFRNRIAHESSMHSISAIDVRHAIALYEKVFREFKFIE